MSHPEAPESGSRPSDEPALAASQKAKKTVEEAADELAVVHVVLDKEIAADARTEDVDRAIEQTDRIEKKLSKSVELLEKVADALDKRDGKANNP